MMLEGENGSTAVDSVDIDGDGWDTISDVFGICRCSSAGGRFVGDTKCAL